MPDVPPELEQSTLLRRRGDVLWRTGDQFLALARVDGHPLTVSGPGADVWARLEREQSWAELDRKSTRLNSSHCA